MVVIDAKLVRNSVFNAASVMQSIGYSGSLGSIHLMDLKLQTNTISAILHNLIGWQISKLSKEKWKFHPKGGNTADLTLSSRNGSVMMIQLKVTSDDRIKGNRITKNMQDWYWVIAKYQKEGYTIYVREILMGQLGADAWTSNDKTQFSFVTKEAESRLVKVWNWQDLFRRPQLPADEI